VTLTVSAAHFRKPPRPIFAKWQAEVVATKPSTAMESKGLVRQSGMNVFMDVNYVSYLKT
jgi:hypothetical protein